MSPHPVPQQAGTFRSITTRDAIGRTRDGEAVVAWNGLSGGQVEVQFADGMWMLCSPQELDAGRFTLAGYQPESWPAAGFGGPSGWATPVVASAVLAAVLEVTGSPHAWDGESVIFQEESVTLMPRTGGLYDLSPLGWHFIQTHEA